MTKTWRGVTLAAALPVLAAAAAAPAAAQEALGEGMTIYMQMGGNPGDGATCRAPMARAPRPSVRRPDLVEQYSGWLPEQMLNHFREALAADPDCIVIMGHPGSGRVRRPGRRGGGARHHRHQRQRAADRAVREVPGGRLRLRRRRAVRGRLADRQEDGRGRQAEGGRQGAGVWPARRGRARPERPQPEARRSRTPASRSTTSRSAPR